MFPRSTFHVPRSMASRIYTDFLCFTTVHGFQDFYPSRYRFKTFFLKPMVFFRFPRRSPRAREMCFFHGLISPFCLWQPNIRTRFPNQKDTEKKMFMCFFNHAPWSTIHEREPERFPKRLSDFS